MLATSSGTNRILPIKLIGKKNQNFEHGRHSLWQGYSIQHSVSVSFCSQESQSCRDSYKSYKF